MVTNYPHQIASRGVPAAAAHREGVGVGTRLLRWVRQLFCRLRGHEPLLQFEEHRMFLKCMACGHESAGWEFDEAPPIVTVRTKTPRAAARARPHLVGERRIA